MALNHYAKLFPLPLGSGSWGTRSLVYSRDLKNLALAVLDDIISIYKAIEHDHSHLIWLVLWSWVYRTVFALCKYGCARACDP